MAALIAFLTLVFAHPTITPARTGAVQPNGRYIVSGEGAFRLVNGKVQHGPKEFHPAFVFSSEAPMRLSFKKAEPGAVTVLDVAGDAIDVRYSDGFIVRKGRAKIIAISHEVESAAALTVGPGGEEYLLVRWQGTCQYAFTLFLLDGDALKETSVVSYPCGI